MKGKILLLLGKIQLLPSPRQLPPAPASPHSHHPFASDSERQIGSAEKERKLSEVPAKLVFEDIRGDLLSRSSMLHQSAGRVALALPTLGW